MPKFFHYTGYESISEAIIEFGNYARENGLNVGVKETLEALEMAEKGFIENIDTFRYALKSIYCCSADERATFDKIFDWFWALKKMMVKSKTTYKNQSNLKKKTQGSVVMMGEGKSEEGGKESKNTSGANAVERLRRTDFSKLGDIESQWLEQIAMKLWQQMSLRLKRKMRSSKTKGQIDLRNTIRHSISHGGDPIDLMKRNKKPKKQRLIILLDVSGSMDKYSFFLLRFVVALRSHFEKIEAFIFSTRLVRITDYLHSKNLELTLFMLSQKADNWSSGTKIGECFKTFNEAYAKQILNGHSTTIVLSDGLDTGEPETLAEELKKIKLRTRKLIWLNPLKGMKDYEPIQRGMSAALPEVDVFRSAHNLNSIMELEEFLLNV